MSIININVIPSVALGGSQVSQMPRSAVFHLERHVRVAVLALALRAGIAQPVARAFVRSVGAVFLVKVL